MNRFETMVKQFKTYVLTEELIKHNGNICTASAALGIHRNTLGRQIEDLGIDIEAIKTQSRTSRRNRPHAVVSPGAGRNSANLSGAGEGSLSAVQGSAQGAPSDAQGDGRVLAS